MLKMLECQESTQTKPHSFLNLTLSTVSYELDETTYRNSEIISWIFPQKNWHYRFFRESRITVLFWQGPVFTCEYTFVLYKVFRFELTPFCISILFLPHKQNLLQQYWPCVCLLTLCWTRGDCLTMGQNHPSAAVNFKGLPSQRAEAFTSTLKISYGVALCHGS